MNRIRERDTCPICLKNYDEANYTGRDGYRFSCGLCGKYEIAESAIPGLPARYTEHYLLRAFIRQQNEFEGVEPVIVSTWPKKVEHLRHTSIRQRQDKILRTIRERSGGRPGICANLNLEGDAPLCDSADAREVDFLTGDLMRRGFVGLRPGAEYFITVDGWDYIDPISGGSPHTAFVAMSFHNDLDEAYDKGILPSLRDDCGKTVIRLKEEHFPEKITDRIVAEIRRARIVIADMTGQRQNAYWEAGFAEGLGRLVIYTCRKNEASDVHFDTASYQHIFWETPEDLRTQLTNRIGKLGA